MFNIRIATLKLNSDEIQKNLEKDNRLLLDFTAQALILFIIAPPYSLESHVSFLVVEVAIAQSL